MLCVCRALAVLGWWSVTWLQHSLEGQVTLPQTGCPATTVALNGEGQVLEGVWEWIFA
jgi:hypothetical protein